VPHLVGWEGAPVVNDEVRLAKRCQLLAAWPDEHVVHEQRVVRPAGDNAHLEAQLQNSNSKRNRQQVSADHSI
jgi:hypothetical protein